MMENTEQTENTENEIDFKLFCEREGLLEELSQKEREIIINLMGYGLFCVGLRIEEINNEFNKELPKLLKRIIRK